MSQKQGESIWTKDITPHVVGFMTADITPHVVHFMTMDIAPDFSSELWTTDITHHVVGTLAVFGLVVSSLVAMAGITTAGVNVEVAFAQQASASQTASVVLADSNRPVPPPMPASIGSTTMPTASSTPMFCPKISRTIMRGNSEGTTTGDVGQLQQFIANHFGLNPQDVVTGHFGSTTQAYLEKFQQEQGIPPAPTAGPLTRAAIARLCGGQGKPPMVDDHSHMGSTTMMGSTTPPMPPQRGDVRPAIGSSTLMGSSTMPHRNDGVGSSTDRNEHPVLPPLPPLPPTPPMPVSVANDNSSNSASVIEAVNEIGDGYGRLITATLSMLGL